MKTKLLLVMGILQLGFILKAQVWFPVGIGPSYRIGALAVYNSELYAGGYFGNSDGTRDVLKWNGTTWSSANRTVSNNVYALAVYNSELYAGGHMVSIGDTLRMTTISKWNGTSWSSVDSGIGTGMGAEFVNALVVYNGDLYAGGMFYSASGTSASNIAKWNGTTWSAVGTGMNGSVIAFTIYNGELYVGGTFTTAGGSPANYIAKWNGTTWSSVGTGMNGSVFALTVYNGELYAGGNFMTAGGNPTNKIAKWNGTIWSAVGNGMDNLVDALVVYNGEIYAGGSFILAGNASANRVAKWDGISWFALGGGMNNSVWTLGVYNSDLYAGGLFTTADNTVANYIAKLNSVNGIKESETNDLINILPNPFSSQATLNTDKLFINATLSVYNSFGQQVKQLKNISGKTITLHRDNLPSGLYFLRLTQDNEIFTTDKLIITDN